MCSFSKLHFQEYTSLLYQWHWYLGSLTLTFYPWQAYSEIPAFMQMILLKHQVSSTSSTPMASLQALSSSHLITSLHFGLSLLCLSKLHPTHCDCSPWNSAFHLSPSTLIILPWSQLMHHLHRLRKSCRILRGVSMHFKTSFMSVFIDLIAYYPTSIVICVRIFHFLWCPCA